MTAALLIRSAGPGVTVQDGGRWGYLRYGVTPAGPMDAGALAAANLAVGARIDAAAIEVSLGGLELEAEGEAIGLAVAGGAFDLRRDGAPLPPACRLTLEPGARLSIRAGAAGAWCYIAIAGRLDLPPALGALATHTRSMLGGLAGRGLAAGDRLALADLRRPSFDALAIEAPWLAPSAAPVRVILGPQDDRFTEASLRAFLEATWSVAARSDRMAYRLEGPRLAHRDGHDIVSDGVALGAIQAPGDGAPLVLMADRQPTGGYPKIANVIGADIARLAQKRPGETLSFTAVTVEEAVGLRRARHEAIAAGVGLRPLAPELTAEFLLAANLIGGVADATED
ncbi:MULTISPECIES: biotin-dependent carboxyltransferase family protein [Methylosinus]|uniref:Urea amidolyase n=1 Tax=Methylosinus trichosporium (strain ATCC 35070 / NCIMB 11131 / UNIQEM 75 / OB3b) TaxID=595536 RepID=A0A2D2CXT4_METT3|nr:MULTISPECIES: biotin-dependent carboxyltransferase family protein [Methylosinus]ATQ67561.1 urea amidolyase [Methylosinus trichosporium OB3b]OBS50797.1 urea amidolyase [Methylosinus sp. 3S-1]